MKYSAEHNIFFGYKDVSDGSKAGSKLVGSKSQKVSYSIFRIMIVSVQFSYLKNDDEK